MTPQEVCCVHLMICYRISLFASVKIQWSLNISTDAFFLIKVQDSTDIINEQAVWTWGWND